MNFIYFKYLPLIILVILVFTFLTVVLEKRFFSMIKMYWFYRRSILSILSSILFLAGISLLLFSLLDARGPEERIKTPTPIQRTIILLDTSASMLAEDVKPSRLQKATLIAKHFARRAVGHQLAIVAFAEIQKKIVPFTNDLDLIDSRLDSLKTLRNQNGSSALSLAIQESIQYFKEVGEARGNILVITDGEETAGSIGLKVPKEIHIALVGVGTTQGGKIPLDDGRGFRFGYKKFQGKDVVTKLNEGFFKQTVADLPSGKYWLANTYSLPSDEIIDFFKVAGVKGQNEQDMIIRPVMMEWLVIPALLLLCLSYLMKTIKIFSLGLLLLIFHPAYSAEVELPQETVEQLNRLQKGELGVLEKLKLANDLNQAGAKDEALSLYEENLPLPHMDKNLPSEAYFNYGTALLEKGEGQKGLTIYEALENELNSDSKDRELKNLINKNVTAFFKAQAEQEKKKKEQKKDQQNKEQQDKDQKNQGQSGDQKNDQQGKGEKNQDKNESGEDKKDQKKDPKDESKDPSEEDKKDPQSKAEEGKEQEKLPPQKIPAKLKQLMSDDRQLQMKMIENGTRDLNKRSKSGKNKDW